MSQICSARRLVTACGVLTMSLTLAACGSNDSSSTGSATAVATTTATNTVTQPADTTTDASAGPGAQKIVAVKAPKQQLAAGSASSSFTVTKVADPLDGGIDEPRPGNKLVGVWIKGQRNIGTKFNPAASDATAELMTSKGPVSLVRVVSDGDCAGAFFPGALLGVSNPKAKFNGCVAFEVPQDAKPQSIKITLTSEGQTQQASWTLPAGS